jgi:hypothetical protein
VAGRLRTVGERRRGDRLASEQNEALPWEVARQMQALRAAKIPALLLARQPWEVSATVLAKSRDSCARWVRRHEVVGGLRALAWQTPPTAPWCASSRVSASKS